MGRYSSDSEDSYYSRKSSKKKKSKSRRSRSRSSSEDSYVRKAKKSKKKFRKRSRSRSRSSERYRKRRSRTRSRDRRRSRTRSTSRHHTSRRSRTRSKSPRASRSRRYSKSRSRSPDRYKRSESPVRVTDMKEEKEEAATEDPCKSIPGFEKLSMLQQNELRMQLALKAAAATDERLRKEGLLPGNVGRSMLSVDELAKRAHTISQIDGEAFVQQSFLSNRAEKPNTPASESSSNATHENAIFSNLPLKMEPVDKKLKVKYTDPESFMGPVLYEDQETKMDRWIKKLTAIRRKKLEGEAMS